MVQARTGLGAGIGLMCIAATVSVVLLRSALKRPPDPPSDE